MDGEHPRLKINTPIKGGTVMAVKKRGATIAGGEGYTIYLESSGIGELTLRGFVIEPSSTAAVVTLDQNGPFLFNLVDCTIDGGYDHSKNTGFSAKWGMIMHRWSGYIARTNIMNIKYEHAIYPHTLTGDTLIYDCHMKRTGRTSIQVCGRENESGYGDAELSIQKSRFEDSGLHGGGSTLTLGGTRRVEVIDVDCTLGLDQAFTQRYLENDISRKAMGQGHLVNWSDKGRQDSVRELVLDNLRMWSAPNAGTAACAQIKAVDKLEVHTAFMAHAGYSPNAVEFAGAPLEYLNTVPLGGVDIKGKVVGW